MAVKLDGTQNALILDATSIALTIKSGVNLAPWTWTLPTNPGAPGDVLITDGTGVTSWSAGGGSITIANDVTTVADLFPIFSTTSAGVLTTAYVASPEYTFNPASGQLSAKHVASTEGMDLNFNTIPVSYTLPANYNSVSGGPVTVPAAVIVTTNAGSRWTVV